MFREARDKNLFRWQDIGDVELGRPNLGPTTLVAVYRMFQYSLRDELIRSLGPEAADRILKNAGKRAGSEFCRATLDTNLGFGEFVAELQNKLKTMGIGILKIESADLERMAFTLTIAEDLDCSGLPVSAETICPYDEGFLSGIFGRYTGRTFQVNEVDCWASGGRVCRFQGVAETREAQ